MTNIYMRRTTQGLTPDMLVDQEQLEKYPIGSLVRAKVTNPRSIPHHRKYWGILSKWIKATGRGYSAEKLHNLIKMDLGYTEPVKLRGKVHMIPDSTSFDKMDQAEFNEFFEKAMALLAEVGGFDPLELE